MPNISKTTPRPKPRLVDLIAILPLLFMMMSVTFFDILYGPAIREAGAPGVAMMVILTGVYPVVLGGRLQSTTGKMKNWQFLAVFAATLIALLLTFIMRVPGFPIAPDTVIEGEQDAIPVGVFFEIAYGIVFGMSISAGISWKRQQIEQ